MIRPTTRTVVLMATGFPVALLPVFVDERLWTGWIAFVALVMLLAGLDALLVWPPRRLRVEVETPAILYIGDADVLRLRLAAPGRARRLPVQVLPELHEDLEAQPLRSLLVPAGEEGVAEIPLVPRRRGRVQVRALWLRWPGPMGLARCSFRKALDADVRVVPNVRAVRLAAVRFFSTREFVTGLKVEQYLGDGTEFEALREFMPGFDHRAIDWKASARHCKLLSREYRAERNHQVVIAIDTGHLMREPLEGVPRLDHAVNAAMLLAYVCLKTGDRVGLLGFDSQVRLYTAPQGSMNAVKVLQRDSAELSYTTAETNFTLALTELCAKLRRRSLVVLFTDFVDTVTAELMVRNLHWLARRHVVVFVTLQYPALDTLARQRPDGLHALNQAVVAEDMLRDRSRVLSKLTRQGIHCIDARAQDVSSSLISRYLEIKRRELV